ncbi:MAG: hypothetical protein QM775_07910 [Pirellulales bacterium]
MSRLIARFSFGVALGLLGTASFSETADAQTVAPAVPAGEAKAPVEPKTAADAPQVEVKTPAVTPAPPSGAPSLSAPPPVAEVPTISPDRYFVMVFGSESYPKRGKYTHTWYTIVKASPNLDVENTYKLEAHTISWMPRSLNIRVIKLRPDCGINLDLHTTLRFVRSQGECVAMWGPYELNPEIAVELYNKSLKQIARLNSGCVLYKAKDPDVYNICNCIHAVSDLDGFSRRSMIYDEVRNYGIAASANLARVITGSGRVDWTVTHDWLLDALELSQYRIQRRSLAPRGYQAPQVAPVSPAVAATPAASTAAR